MQWSLLFSSRGLGLKAIVDEAVREEKAVEGKVLVAVVADKVVYIIDSGSV